MKRRRAARSGPRLARVLLVCGGKTEFNYFATLKHVRGTELRVVLIVKEVGAGSPEVVVREAVKRRTADSDFERGDRCACLLDVEPHDPSMTQSLTRALALASSQGIEVYPTPVSRCGCWPTTTASGAASRTRPAPTRSCGRHAGRTSNRSTPRRSASKSSRV